MRVAPRPPATAVQGPAGNGPQRTAARRGAHPSSKTAPSDAGSIREPRVGLFSAIYFHYYGDMEKRTAIAALAALAQDTRLDIFRLLVQAGGGGMPAGLIAERLALPSATLSFHLNQLKHAGLVTFRREGRSLIYVAEYDAMNGLLAFLTENCCQGERAPSAVPAP